MKDYIIHHEWEVIEKDFHAAYNRVSESLFSLGNGYTGQRANFEEAFSGDTLQGNYLAGIYYPDKTRVGWWKNGYPEYFAKILNTANWIGMAIQIDREELDLAKSRIDRFERRLNMQTALLTRKFTAVLPSGKAVKVKAERFLSIDRKELGLIRYRLKALNFSGLLKITPFIDGDVRNEDSNYKEKFWTEIAKDQEKDTACLLMETKKTGFRVCHGMTVRLTKNGKPLVIEGSPVEKEKFVARDYELFLQEGETLMIEKYVAIHASLYHDQEELVSGTKNALQEASALGFDRLFEEHRKIWLKKWETSDIRIDGDIAAQQGIRFNIFHLMQTYTGADERLNIGPKGFTGEKYGGVTYWDTEAFCLPFFLGTASRLVGRNLLLYRHKHLLKAIENASKLGFGNGAALYPMVTINGEECHNEWEITFEEIHRNGAIAYAICNYINYTGDREYLAPFGFEVLLALSRFWSQRVKLVLLEKGLGDPWGYRAKRI